MTKKRVVKDGVRTVKAARYNYEGVAADIHERIRNGEWPQGTRMPTVDVFTEEYPHSRVTVNKALQLLERKGVISMDRGRGIYALDEKLSRRIGLLIGPSLIAPRQSPFAAVVAQAAQDYFDEMGQDYKLYIEKRSLLSEGIPSKSLQRDLLQRELEGLITTHCDAPKTLATSRVWMENRIPVVDMGGHHFIPHQVTGDSEPALRKAFALARERGCRNVAVFHFAQDNAEIISALCGEFGIETQRNWFFGSLSGHSIEESGYLNMLGLWSHNKRPDALLIQDDVVAKGVSQAILKLGISLPGDLCVMACANKGSGIFLPQPIVQLEVDPMLHIRAAAELLHELMENPDLPPRQIKIPSQLRLEDGKIWNP